MSSLSEGPAGLARCAREDGLRARQGLAARLRSASAHLVTLDPRADGLLVPSKLYAAMASGRPVIVVASDRNELALELERGGFGVRIEPGDVDGFVSAVKRLARDRALADETGKRARAAFLERHRGSVCMQRFHHILRGPSVGVSGGGGHKIARVYTHTIRRLVRRRSHRGRRQDAQVVLHAQSVLGRPPTEWPPVGDRKM